MIGDEILFNESHIRVKMQMTDSQNFIFLI